MDRRDNTGIQSGKIGAESEIDRVGELTLPVMRCILILPSREWVRVIGQKRLGFGVGVPVFPTKNRVEREFSPKHVPEDVSTKV